MECKGKILIVDDNEDILLSLNMLLRPWVDSIRAIKEPTRIIEFMDYFKPDVIVLDMNFERNVISGEEGYEWLSRIQEHDPTSVVILMTAYVNTEKTVRAIKAGAVDFIPKPWENKKMIDAIHSAVDLKRSRIARLQAEKEEKERKIEKKNGDARLFVGESPQIRELKERIARIASTDANVLITGENGVGKDVVAHELHRLSARSGRPMVSIDLGCIPESLFESELFGHEKGAFTGAGNAKAGRIEEADGGTLFLDEVGNLTTATQQKLLTVIERREVQRVGSTKARKIDVRIVAATNANLPARVAEGTFREDLLYRLNTIELRIPPLRERGEDILLLARHFLKIYAEKYRSEVKEFSQNEEKQLMSYRWPGNVRELQHCIERWVIDSSLPLVPEKRDEAGKSASLNLEELERQTIRRALEQSNGNLSMAAELLGITRYSLYRKIDKHGI
ncbi:MAG: sigma-54-dependent Fis family transcriptional regulator [Bacteroidaceae bacterium]|nr:sigma-54-dependent Fis family transcriptional regulator [Bacteroidaceae bacterium]